MVILQKRGLQDNTDVLGTLGYTALHLPSGHAPPIIVMTGVITTANVDWLLTCEAPS